MLVTGAGIVTLQFDSVNVRDQMAAATLTTLESAIANVSWGALPDSVPLSFCATITTHQPELTVEIYWSGRQSRITDSHWCDVISQVATEPQRRARDAVRQLRDLEDELLALPAVAEAMRRHRP